jgi:hypothetical protein
MPTAEVVSDRLSLERERQRRQLLLDRIVAARGKNERRSEGIDAIAAEGNFLVTMPGVAQPLTVARFVRWCNEQQPELGSASAGAVPW